MCERVVAPATTQQQMSYNKVKLHVYIRHRDPLLWTKGGGGGAMHGKVREVLGDPLVLRVMPVEVVRRLCSVLVGKWVLPIA